MVEMINNSNKVTKVPSSTQEYYESLGWTVKKQTKNVSRETKKEENSNEYLDKPISEWTTNELKEYVEENKIKLAKNAKLPDVKAAVKKHLEG